MTNLPTIRCLTALTLALALAGCKSSPPPQSQDADMQLAAHPTAAAPARPAVPAPPFKLFHHDATSITLVTKDNASDDEMSALLWQLHDAAQSNSFDKIGIPQKLVDARDPILWFHIYRGAKCASEKYTSGKLPCGASYHAAGDYTLGSFTDKHHDDGILIHDENHETHLWADTAH